MTELCVVRTFRQSSLNPSTALPPFWMMKLTEDWGEPKNDSKGEDDGLKIEHFLPRSIFNCFQNGGLTRFLKSVRKKTPALQATEPPLSFVKIITELLYMSLATRASLTTFDNL